MARIAGLLALGAGFAAAAPGSVCDIFAAGGTPCVAAHSMVRALFASYAGPLYQVKRVDNNKTLDVSVVAPGGLANSAAQDAFCGNSCVVQRIYDQSPRGNTLDLAPPGGNVHHGDAPVNASLHPITVRGTRVYGAFFTGGQGYRIDKSNGVATGNDPETLYMVTSGTHVNDGCCFDYGNAEVTNDDNGAGTMEAVYFGTSRGWGHGAGAGPWVMADLENGLWAGSEKENLNNTPLTSEFVTAMVKGNTNGFALKGGDATRGTLTTMWNGPRPNNYQPMRKQGSIILGGDNSNRAIGTWYEGVMTTGFSSDAVDNAVQANIVAAGYGQ